MRSDGNSDDQTQIEVPPGDEETARLTTTRDMKYFRVPGTVKPENHVPARTPVSGSAFNSGGNHGVVHSRVMLYYDDYKTS